MSDIDFFYKTINDPIHGSINLSDTEFGLIRTPTFLRLNRLNHLGLAHFVFPGATHTRMSHSLGSLKTMTLMIDSINRNAKRNIGKASIDDEEKQNLRISALLHDIGHYPLSHASEVIFWKTEGDKPKGEQAFKESVPKSVFQPLNDMCNVKKEKAVSHEKFGKFLIEQRNDIAGILKDNGIDPTKIGATITSEKPDRQIYSQLIHSALDADRLDFLLRDAYNTGVTYGKVDLEFLIKNLKYDPDEDMFAVDYKGIPSFEHFLISRYFMYNNIIYHKTIMGFELMAKALYYKMVMDGIAIGDFNDLKSCSIHDNDEWFSFYHDEYYWSRLKEWKPSEPYYQMLKNNLIRRIGLKVIYEERRLIENINTDVESKFHVLKKKNIKISRDFISILNKFGIEQDCIALLINKVNFEDESPITGHREATPDKLEKELGKVYENYKFKDIIEVDNSIISKLSQYTQHIRRLYLFNKNNVNMDSSLLRDLQTQLNSTFS